MWHQMNKEPGEESVSRTINYLAGPRIVRRNRHKIFEAPK